MCLFISWLSRRQNAILSILKRSISRLKWVITAISRPYHNNTTLFARKHEKKSWNSTLLPSWVDLTVFTYNGRVLFFLFAALCGLPSPRYISPASGTAYLLTCQIPSRGTTTRLRLYCCFEVLLYWDKVLRYRSNKWGRENVRVYSVIVR